MKALIPDVDGLQVEIGGQIFAEFVVPSSEALGLAFAAPAMSAPPLPTPYSPSIKK